MQPFGCPAFSIKLACRIRKIYCSHAIDGMLMRLDPKCFYINRDHAADYTSGAPKTRSVQCWALLTTAWSLGYFTVWRSIQLRSAGEYIEKRMAEMARKSHPCKTGSTRPASPSSRKTVARVRTII